MSNHPFAARPNLTKRHTSPSPSALLALQTLEALPPTPKEAEDPGNDLLRARNRQLHTVHKAASTSFRQPERPVSSQAQQPIEIKMPLIKTRLGSQSMRPTSSSNPKTKAASGSAASYPNLFPWDITFNFGSKGRHQRIKSHHHSQPPPASPSNHLSGYDVDFGPAHRDSDHQHYRSFSPFSSSTPPSFSKASLNAMPSIQGVIDAYDAKPDYLRLSLQSEKRRGRSKKERRDTLCLPMMDLRFQAEPITPESAARTDSPMDRADTVEILGEMDPYGRGISLSTFSQPADRFQAPSQDLRELRPQYLLQGRRSRHVSLTIDTALLPGQTGPSKESSATSSRSQAQSRTHTHSRPESQALSVPSQHDNSVIDQDGSEMSAWLGDRQEGEGDLDDVEMQALTVLEHFNGHLMRDGYGYGTGSGASITTDQSASHNSSSAHQSRYPDHYIASNNNADNTGERNSRTNSSSHVGSASSINRLSVKTGSTGVSSHSPSARSGNSASKTNGDRDNCTPHLHSEQEMAPVHRKRSKSYGFSISHNTHSSTNDMHQHHHTRGRGSISIPPHRPPPPPPEGDLPPVPMSISPLVLGPPIHGAGVPTRVQHKHNNNTLEARFDQEARMGSFNGVMGNVYQGNDVSMQEALHENNRYTAAMSARGRSPTNTGAPPIPPRSASRSAAPAQSERNQSLSRKSSKRVVLQQGDFQNMITIPGRKSSKDKGAGVRVPLVLATTDQEDVVIIERRPQTPVTNLPSPLEPIYQRPLPPLPAPPAMQIVSPQRTPSIPQPKLTARILRPKRPTTAPSATVPMFPVDRCEPMIKLPLVKLIPREEPRRLSPSAEPSSSPASISALGSPMRSKKGRKEGMSALSFLALDEAAASQRTTMPPAPPHPTRSTSYGSGVTTISFQPYTQAITAQAEPPDGLEGGHIMPPKERSKIGIDIRAEQRRRRRGSQSSLSSVAGSEDSRICNDIGQGGTGDEGGVMLGGNGMEGGWSTAWEYNHVKEERKQKELRLSLQVTSRPQGALGAGSKAFPNPLSPPPRSKNRPAPLDTLLLYRDDPGDISVKPMLKSAGLLPPPRPRRKTVPSGPVLPAVSTHVPAVKARAIARPAAISIEPVSPVDNDHSQHACSHTQSPTCRQISPKYTHRANLDPVTPKAYDGMRDFMELDSHSPSPSPCGSPKLETPGAFIFPHPSSLSHPDRRSNTSNIEPEPDADVTVGQQARKLSAFSETSDTRQGPEEISGPPVGLRDEEVEQAISLSGSISTWSSESEREKERRIMTSLWLSAKPTKARDYIAQPATPAGEGDPSRGSGSSGPVSQGSLERSHPFYGTVGRGRGGVRKW
ncbi:hypothetical protein IAU59_001051 [Kwoniella sp. CBS 9459]